MALVGASAPLSAEKVPEGLAASDWSSIRAAYEANRHGFFQQTDGSYAARNHAQGWQMSFDGKGFTARPDGGGWEWGLELREMGRRGVEETGRQERVAVNRLSVQRNANLEEWFINDGRGLEQGWTIHSKPETGENKIQLRLTVRGNLRAQGSGQSVSFTDANGGTVLTYGGLKAWDATGRTLPAHMAGEGDQIRIAVEAKDAVYPVTIDPIAQNTYLKASNTGTDQLFGYSVAVSGDTVVIGAAGEGSNATGVNGNEGDDSADNAGAAYVFVRNGSTWTQQAYLKASNTGAQDYFGYSVAVSGDIVVVGAPYEDSNATGVNGDQGDNSAGYAGAAYVFTRNGSIWSQKAYLKGDNTATLDEFGHSVAVAGNTVVVGSAYAMSNGGFTGAAYVFTLSGGTWSQQAQLLASNAGFNDLFGWSVAVSGDTIVVGATHEDSSATGVDGNQADNGASISGAAYIFVRSGTSWTQQAYLKASNTEANDQFGRSVAVSDDTVIVGAPFEDSNATGFNGNQGNNSALNSGAAYVFVRSGTSWSQQAYLKASNTGAEDRFGDAVAVSGDTGVVGAWMEDSNATGIDGNGADNSASLAGAAYVFGRSGGFWSQQAYLKASNAEADDDFGMAVAISGDTVVIGANGEDSNATGINGDQANNSANLAGAAYIFHVGHLLQSLAKTKTSAPGGVDLVYQSFAGQALSQDGTAHYLSALQGDGLKAGKNKGLFSAAMGGLDYLSLRQGTELSGVLGLPTGARVSVLGNPVDNSSSQQGVFTVKVAGTGLTSSSNTLLLLDNGNYLTPLARTGVALTSLGDVVPASYLEVLQHGGAIQELTIPALLKKGAANVTSGNDSILLRYNHAGTLLGNLPREGNPAYASVDSSFGQIGAAIAHESSLVFFLAPVIPNIGGAPLASVFTTSTSPFFNGRYPVLTQGSTPGSANPGETFRSFTGVTSNGLGPLVTGTLTGSPVSKNQGVWNWDNQLKLRKGDVVEGDATVSQIVRVWGGVEGQVILLVKLKGPGVNASNNQALLLRQHNDALYILMRSGRPVTSAGLSTAKVGVIQSVDVDSASGRYVVLTSLKGMPASANQALWTGNTDIGHDVDAPHLRLPSLLLRKGQLFRTDATNSDIIKGLAIRPHVDKTGVGGRGQGRIINPLGHILVEITGNLKAKELVRLVP